MIKTYFIKFLIIDEYGFETTRTKFVDIVNPTAAQFEDIIKSCKEEFRTHHRIDKFIVSDIVVLN